MLWFRLALVLLLTGCGFSPLHSVQSFSKRGQIEIANIPDWDGQFLRNRLIDQLYIDGNPANPIYTLKLTPLQKQTVELGIRKDATATRAQIQISTHMTLLDKTTERKIIERDVKVSGAYDLLDNQYATLISQRSMTESLLQELGDEVVTQLNLTLLQP